jgi:hypothetical protein
MYLIDNVSVYKIYLLISLSKVKFMRLCIVLNYSYSRILDVCELGFMNGQNVTDIPK